jgi:hypothetical protein
VSVTSAGWGAEFGFFSIGVWSLNRPHVRVNLVQLGAEYPVMSFLA